MSPTSRSEAERKRAERKKEKEKKKRETEKRASEAALTDGFDHGFGNLASYKGYEAGEKEGEFRTSHSATIQKEPEPQPQSNPPSNTNNNDF